MGALTKLQSTVLKAAGSGRELVFSGPPSLLYCQKLARCHRTASYTNLIVAPFVEPGERLGRHPEVVPQQDGLVYERRAQQAEALPAAPRRAQRLRQDGGRAVGPPHPPHQVQVLQQGQLRVPCTGQGGSWVVVFGLTGPLIGRGPDLGASHLPAWRRPRASQRCPGPHRACAAGACAARCSAAAPRRRGVRRRSGCSRSSPSGGPPRAASDTALCSRPGSRQTCGRRGSEPSRYASPTPPQPTIHPGATPPPHPLGSWQSAWRKRSMSPLASLAPAFICVPRPAGALTTCTGGQQGGAQ